MTRAGPGTKMVCLGNIAQIDTPYLTETTTGLTYADYARRGFFELVTVSVLVLPLLLLGGGAIIFLIILWLGVLGQPAR